MGKDKILKEILTKPKPLSKDQKEVVVSDKRYIRVIAGAGTGKTETLTRRVIYLLLYCGVEPKEIVAFTFTDKAAQNMKSRIYQRVKELKGEETCAKLGEMYVGTIHGYCLRILQDYFGYGEYDLLDEHQEMAFLMRIGWDLGLGKSGRYVKNCEKFIESVNIVYDELIDRKTLKKKAPDFCRDLQEYETFLDQNRLLTLGQIVALAVQKIKENPKRIRHIKHLIVDEYQDINRAQEELIKIIGEKASVFIVGDPRQSIYQWRGSNERCFEEFPKHFKKVATFNLKENRRSVKEIVKTANTFADTFERCKYEHIIPVRENKGLTLLVEFETPEDEANWIIRQIERYVSRRLCQYNDCAILLRSVRTSSEPFIKLLKDRNIPYIVGGTAGLFTRDEAKAMGYFFSWLWDDGFWVENHWNWDEQIKGHSLLEKGISLWSNATGIKLSSQKTREDLKLWRNKVLSGEFSNFTEIFHELLIILGYKSLEPDDRLYAAIMANLGRFSALLADYESSIRRGGIKPKWRDDLKGLCWFLNTYASGAYEEQQPDDIRSIDAVQIMTIHQAKGLEWPIVFIPSMVDKRFPSSRIGSKKDWFVPRNMFDVKRYEGEIEDERRLFYVAMTRARDILCITYFRRTNNKSRNRSIFIDKIEKVMEKFSPQRNIPMINISPPSFEDDLQTYYVGEILTYLKCPHFYRLRELWGYKPGLVEPLGYGKSLHLCLRCASELISKGIDPIKAVKKAIEEEFHIPYASGRIKENMKKKAEEVLINFVSENIEEMNKIQEVEARLEFPLQKATIVGRVDVIFKDENILEVRDYKTSTEITTYEQAALQLRLYTLGLRMLGKPVMRASIAYLDGKEVNEQIKKVTINEKELQNAREIAEKSIKSILQRNFKAKPENGYCRHCDYKRICKWGSIVR